jgi:hypothetical protein
MQCILNKYNDDDWLWANPWNQKTSNSKNSRKIFNFFWIAKISEIFTRISKTSKNPNTKKKQIKTRLSSMSLTKMFFFKSGCSWLFLNKIKKKTIRLIVSIHFIFAFSRTFLIILFVFCLLDHFLLDNGRFDGRNVAKIKWINTISLLVF